MGVRGTRVIDARDRGEEGACDAGGTCCVVMGTGTGGVRRDVEGVCGEYRGRPRHLDRLIGGVAADL